MNAHPEIVPSLVDRIKQTLVALKMPRAIEILDVILRRLEHGEITAIEAIDALLALLFRSFVGLSIAFDPACAPDSEVPACQPFQRPRQGMVVRSTVVG
jgi:hypothetical protein